MPANITLYALGAGALVALFLLQRVWELRKARKASGNLPGWTVLINPALPLPGNGVPGLYKGRKWAWEAKHDHFAMEGTDVLTLNSMLPVAMSIVHIADATALKEVTSSRHKFPKPTESYALLKVFGPNIVTTEGHEWQRHRKPAAPAFSERNNKFVWDESTKIALDLFESKAWRGHSEVFISHAVDLTLPMALFVIGVAGFGHRVSWDDGVVIPPGHTMTFKNALHIVAANLPTRILLPKWAYPLRQSWREVGTAFEELDRFMKELIDARRSATIKEERFDLFSGLLDATDQDDEKSRLTDRELAGNVFVYQVAGHETTAHTLAFTFGLLSLYGDVQDKLYEHIVNIIGDDLRLPGYDEYNKFTYVQAVLNETLRLFPPALGTIKKCVEDTTISTDDTKAGFRKTSVFIPAGTYVGLTFAGLHYNPKYWPEPNAFRPERFMDSNWPRDAFMPFSGGARSCIGRRFFECEAVALLVTILSRYKISLGDDPEWAGITDVELKREKVLRTGLSLTLCPARLPLVFTRRQ